MSFMRVQLMAVSVAIVLAAGKGSDGVTFTLRVETPLGVYEAQVTQAALLSLAAQLTAVANS
jgi:hypothetical protein